MTPKSSTDRRPGPPSPGAAVALHRAFHEERRFIELNMCPCGSCTKTSGLKLKFVAHLGEVATQTIRRREKLVGLDVIQVHRLLKNPVEVPEYLLVSEDLYAGSGSASSALPLHEVGLDLEGIGPVQTHYVDLQDLPSAPALADPSWPQRIGSTFAMVGRGIPHIIARRRPRVLSPAG